MQRLVGIVAPDIAVITQIAWAHAAYFPEGLFGIAKGKAEIFSQEKTKVCIFDYGLYEYPEAISQICGEAISFSEKNSSADYFLTSDCFVDEKGVRAYQFDPPFREGHVLHNFLAALTICRQMGMEWDEINRQVVHLKLPKMRFERFEKGGVTFINDAYNANPDSMRAALSHMPEPKVGGRRIAVLGMMADMGPNSEAIHRDLGQFASKSVDLLLAMGEGATPICEGFGSVSEQYLDFDALAERLKALIEPGDVVLVKASRVVQMEKLFSLLEVE